MSSQKHEFVKNVCKICGLSKASVQHFKWTCKEECEVVDCLFCGTRNRLKTNSKSAGRLKCGRCGKPLFVKRAADPLSTLEDLIGLANVKNELRRILALISIGIKREAKGFKAPSQALHFVFQGAPGTGKTEVARVLAGSLKQVGYLTKGQLVETDRSGLIGQHFGDTEARVIEKCREALGGVLFIDEAYALFPNERDLYGKAAIDTLLKFMEDNRRDLVVIVAGYTDNMRTFLRSNPGLKSRFTRYVDFPEYTPRELYEIFYKMLNDSGYYVESGMERRQLIELFESLKSNDHDFGNARGVRTVSERLFAIHAERVASCSNPTNHEFAEIVADDFATLCKEMGIPTQAYPRIIAGEKNELARKKHKGASIQTVRPTRKGPAAPKRKVRR